MVWHVLSLPPIWRSHQLHGAFSVSTLIAAASTVFVIDHARLDLRGDRGVIDVGAHGFPAARDSANRSSVRAAAASAADKPILSRFSRVFSFALGDESNDWYGQRRRSVACGFAIALAGQHQHGRDSGAAAAAMVTDLPGCSLTYWL